MAEEKKLPLQATVKNESKEMQIYYWNGIPYIWSPGEVIKGLPIGVAGHFIGMDKVGLLEESEPNALVHEKQRVLDLIPKDKQDAGCPLALVEMIDPNELAEAKKKEIVSEPVPERDEGEKPFASLEPEKEPDLVAKALEKKKPGRPRKEKEPVK